MVLTAPKTQRLFFALWPDPALRKELHLIQTRYPGGRPTHVSDLHVTLVFLGVVPKERYSCVTAVADSVCGQVFRLEIDKIGYWRRPRILWCAPSIVPSSLEELVGSLQRGLEACGFEPERRAYSPHLTLARKARPVEERALEEPLVWSPAKFVLVASNSGSAPPHYQVLKKWPLKSVT